MAGSFKTDIVPLFSPADVQHMNRMEVKLDNYAYMSNPAGDDDYPDHANARHCYGHLTGEEQPKMPIGAPPWDAGKLKTFSDWMNVAPAFSP